MGIYIIWAPPRQGKTYYATRWALKELVANKKKVITNYPILHKKYASYKWHHDLVYEGLRDAFIIIDEAYREVSSREWQKFDKETHTFFATNGHNNNDIIVIAQNPARVDTIIREMCNEFILVQKKSIPFTGRPLWFKVESYLDELQMSRRHTSEDAIYSSETVLFRRYVAKAYDTHFFRIEDKTPTLERWDSLDYRLDHGEGQVEQKKLADEDLRTTSDAEKDNVKVVTNSEVDELSNFEPSEYIVRTLNTDKTELTRPSRRDHPIAADGH